MCGIASIIYPKKNGIGEITQMLSIIQHRGDSEPRFECFGNSILGITRLKIVDFKNGDQPFYNEDKTIGVVFNGEIYNYKELKADLLSKSHRFYSDCDSEVLVHLYEEYGKTFLLKLQGMFSFVIYNLKTENFWAVRDFFGVKPLFYAINNNSYYLASELKVFNSLKLDEYFEVPPGYYLTKEGLTKYYQIPRAEFLTNSLFEITDNVRIFLETAVRKRVDTELPIAVFMGGGIDSAIVNLLACKYHSDVTSIIIGKNDSEDVLFGLKLCEDFNLKYLYIPLSEQQIIDSIPDVINSIETFEPNLVRGSVISDLLAKLANINNFKVVLCGEGSDEIFGGYGDFLNTNSDDEFQSLLFKYLNDLYRTQLQRIDRTGMRYGVEIREPFLDRDLVEYALRIPPSMKTTKLSSGKYTTKFILREAFKDLLPEYIYSRDKQTMMDGAGIGEVDKNKGLLYHNAESCISDSEFIHYQLEYPEYSLNTKEDVLNFKIFKKSYLKATFSKRRVNIAQQEIRRRIVCQPS